MPLRTLTGCERRVRCLGGSVRNRTQPFFGAYATVRNPLEGYATLVAVPDGGAHGPPDGELAARRAGARLLLAAATSWLQLGRSRGREMQVRCR